MTLSQPAKDELNRWVNNILSSFNQISHLSPSLIITSDASHVGWGAACSNISTGGTWSERECQYHINYLEIQAAFFALKTFAKSSKDDHVRLMIDNTTAVSVINHMGTSHCDACHTLTKENWEWWIPRGIWIGTAHIPGKANTVADHESRKTLGPAEWKLYSKSLRTALDDLKFHPEIDLFASRVNHQFLHYCSFRPDPTAEAIDAFTINWHTLKCYAFLPFSIMPAVLKKIQTDKGEGMCTTQLANPIVVSQGHENDNSTTSRTKTMKGPADPSQRPHSMPSPTHSTTLVSVSLTRKQLNNTGVSAAAQEVIMASWWQGTLKQYKTFLAKWELFCRNNKISPSQATTEDGIEFLTSLFNSGLGYSALNKARSALSAVMKINDNMSFGEHPLVWRFIKDVFQLKPELPKYTHIWDVERVLSNLQTLAPVTSLDLKQLSLKLATLLAILTGQRCQTIHKLDLNLMQTLPDTYMFVIGEKLKHTRLGQHHEPI